MKIRIQILCPLLLALSFNAHADLTTPSQHEVTEAQKQQNRIESQQQDYLSAPNARTERIDTSNITQGLDGSARIEIEHTDLTVGAIFDHSTISYGLEYSRILKLGYYKSPETNVWRFVWGLDIPMKISNATEAYLGFGMQMADKKVGGTKLYAEGGMTQFLTKNFIVKVGVNQIFGDEFGFVLKTGFAF